MDVKRYSLACCLAGALFGCGSEADTSGEAGAPSAPPHVLFISIDTLRADHLDAYGYARPTAPRLAALARGGALFERCIAVSNWTLPTHTTLFTGLHPVVHEVEEHRDVLDPSRATLGEAFAAAGYETVGFYSNPFVGEKFGFARGFESYSMLPDIEGMRANMEKKGTRKGAISRSFQPEPGIRSKDYFVEQSAEPITAAALAFLEARDNEQPFLMFLHYNDVHSDYIPPAPMDRRFNPEYAGTITAEDYPRNRRVHRRMSADDMAQVQSLYDGEIAWVDQHIGQVLDALEQGGLAENTLVVVTADHGEGFFEHGGKEHHYGLYDELVHIPFLVGFPGRVAPGQRITHPVSQADIAPTLLDLAGVDGLPDADGQSWARQLLGERAEGRLGGRAAGRPRPVFSRAILKPILDEAGDLVLALRTEELSIMRHLTPEGVETLKVYDLSTDPDESTPLPADHPDVARGRQLLELVNARMNARRESLQWSGEGSALDDDPELLEQMIQWGYIERGK